MPRLTKVSLWILALLSPVTLAADVSSIRADKGVCRLQFGAVSIWRFSGIQDGEGKLHHRAALVALAWVIRSSRLAE